MVDLSTVDWRDKGFDDFFKGVPFKACWDINIGRHRYRWAGGWLIAAEYRNAMKERPDE